MDRNSGALPKLAMPVKYFVGSALGSGKQAMPWVSIEDVCSGFECMLHSKVQGICNLVADDSCTNEGFVRSLGKVLHRPIVFPKVPAFILKAMLGESSMAILQGQFVSNKKIKDAGFRFVDSNLELALQKIYATE